MNLKNRRRLAVVPFVALGLLLTACNPSQHAVEKSATASTLRRVGYPSTTSNQIGCTDEGLIEGGGDTIYLSACTITTPGVSMQPSQVSTVYDAATATATVLTPNKVIPSSLWQGGDITDYQRVVCTYTQSGGAWTGTSCTGPVLVPVD